METVTTRFQHIMLPAQDENGKHILSVIAKRTYDILPNERLRASETQAPLTPGDLYFNNGDPLTTSCEQESDYVPYKCATDVVFNGKAYAPHKRKAIELPVELHIGKWVKRIIVFGNRTCTYRKFFKPVYSEPEPFYTMDIRYENTYGGTNINPTNGQNLSYPRNPIGKGFIFTNTRESLNSLELPNLEDPNDILTPEFMFVEKMENWQNFPMPQSFGWYGKSWFPRATFAGVMPADTPLYDEIREAHIGYVPKEHIEDFKKLKMKVMDFRFFNGATPGLSFPFLSGNEVVKLVNLDPHFPDLRFMLPGEKPSIGIDTGDGPKEVEVYLHTVMILKEQNQVCLTWRGSLPYGGPDQFKYFKDFDIVVE